MKKLTDKKAVITGGSSGIGLETAKLFHSEGAKVIIIGRNQDKLNQAAKEIGENVWTISSDISTVDGIEDALKKVEAIFGNIDILFANAGISDSPELFETKEEDYNHTMDSNVKSVFFLFTKAFHLLNDNASVIFTSSVAHKMGRPGDPLYAASKAAVRSLGRTFAMQEQVLAKKIRVNVVSPGAVQTPLTKQDSTEMQTAIDQYIESAVPMGRWASALEISKGVLFLASDDSSYLTGSDLVIDGGWSEV